MIDPVVLVSAMAAVTNSVGFAVTGSTSYISQLFVLDKNNSELCT